MSGDRGDWNRLREAREQARAAERRPAVERALRVAAAADDLVTSEEWRVFHEHLQALIEDAENLYRSVIDAARDEPSFDAGVMAARKAQCGKAYIRLLTLREMQQLPQTLREAATLAEDAS